MRILRGQCRPFLISIACGLVLVCTPVIWAQPAGASKDSQSNADSAPFVIEKLAKMLIGKLGRGCHDRTECDQKGPKGYGHQSNRSGSGRSLCHRKLLH